MRVLATALLAAGCVEASTRLFGAEAHARLNSHEQLTPSDERDYTAALGQARSALGDDAFDVAWAAGQETALVQAMAEALGVAD